MTVHVRLLGRPSIAIGDQGWEPPADRRSALLYYVAHARGWVPREDLLYLFWPDAEEHKGRANLRQLLVAVRALPFSVGLEVERTRVRWPVTTDVARWRERFAGDDPPDPEDGWLAPFLEGFRLADVPEYESWLELERATWLDRLRGFAHEAAEGAARRGRDDVAAAFLDRWWRANPLDEEALRAWLQVAARLGRSTAALERYAAFERLLAEEMQLAPERATVDLIAALRAGPPAAASGPAEAADGASLGMAASAGRQRPWTPRARPRRVGFVGRERELERLTKLLDAEEGPVVTLLGPGGIGKTRLAMEAVAALRPRFADGVVVAELSDAVAVGAVAPAVAVALDLEVPPGSDVVERVEVALAGRRALVLLDNVEQLPGVADLVARWRASAPGVAWLLTSRSRVGVPDEAVLELAGLPIPGDAGGADLMSYGSVDLLVRRARAVGSELDPVRQAAAVVRVCRATGGMPLALELAAGWLRVLPLEAIADELEAGLELLDAEDASVDPRHRTMRAVFDASWAALSDRERGALERLAAFYGGFTETAALEVADVGRPLLLALRNKSFLSLDPPGRFVRHPLLEAYVRERARADEDAWRTARERHAAWYCAMLARCEAMGQSGRHREANALLQAEHPNVEAAWSVALELGWWDALKMGGATLGLSYATAGRPDRWGELLREALARIPRDTSAWALIEVHESSLDHFLGRTERAYARRRHALEVLRADDDRHALAWGLFLAAESAHALGDAAQADAWLVESAGILRDLDDPHVLGMVLQHRCDLADDVDDVERRHRDLREHLAVTRNLDHEAIALQARASFVACTYGAYAEALALADRAVEIERWQQWAPMHLGNRLRTAARIRVATGDLAVAAAQAREALELARTIEGFVPWPVPEAEVLLATVAWLRGDPSAAEALLPATGRAARTTAGLVLRSAMALERGDLVLARGCADQALAEASAAAVGRDGRLDVVLARTASARVALALGERAAAVHDLSAALEIAASWRFAPALLEACAVAIDALPAPLAAELAVWVVAHPATPFGVRRRVAAAHPARAPAATGMGDVDPGAWAAAVAMATRVREVLTAGVGDGRAARS